MTNETPRAGSPSLTPRMREIVDAGIEVIARGGMRGLTHRAVDAEAGLPPGSTSGYLRTRLALTVAVAHRVISISDLGVAGLAQRLDGRPLTDEQVRDAVVDLFVGWLDRPALLAARQELVGEANRHDEVAEVVGPARRAVEDLVVRMLRRLGASDPQELAPAVLAAGEGVLGAAMSCPEEAREEYVRTVMCTVVEAFVPVARSERAG